MKEQILAVQRMQDYIEKNWEKEITLAQLSQESLYSPWHSYRIFREYTGFTPAEYRRKLRLSKSVMRLKKKDCRIIDIAYDMGFSSVDGYQRAFRKEFGCNPAEYVKTGMPITLFVPYGVKFREIRKESRDMEKYKVYLFR